jgi:hypothetical protein
MRLPAAVALLLSLPGCALLCRGPGRLEILLSDAEGAPVAADSVVLTSAGGDEVELSPLDTGWYEYSGEPDTYTVTVSACGGEQVIEATIEVPPSDECEDKYEVTDLDLLLDPC